MQKDESFYDQLVKVPLSVPCSSWNDSDYAINCFGPDYASKTVGGFVEKVRYDRKTKQPKFDIIFPLKKGDKRYTGFPVEYIWKHSTEVPLKYHTEKAAYIVKLANEASLAALNAPSSEAEDLLNEGTSAPEAQSKCDDFELNVDDSDEASKKQPEPKPKKKRTSKCKGNELNVPKKVCADASVVEDELNNSDMEQDEEEELEESESEDEKPTLEEDIGNFHPSMWVFNAMPQPTNSPFLGMSGPQHSLHPNSQPFQFFCLFIPIFFWERWAQYTNQKAEMETDNGRPKARKWTPVCAAEIKAWVASVMYWCLFKNMSFKDFYSCDLNPVKVKQWFPSFMRWEQIKRFFKISPPYEDAAHKEDKMVRVREFYEDFIARCKANYYPAAQIALDEAIKKFKGRCSFKQYIKNKPVRWGVKIFCICCSNTAYFWNGAFYLGKTGEAGDDIKENSATHRAVISLLSPLANKNHICFMDNYYTSIPLLLQLERMGIKAAGTIRTNRKGLCQEVTIRKTEHSQLKKTPGYSRWASYGSLCYVAWFDKRPVHMLTTCYQPHGTGEDASVVHWYPMQKGEEGYVPGKKVQKEVNLPPVVYYYNLYKSFVDLFDQFRSYVSLELKSFKFWHPMFWFLAEAALVNSWVLYKSTRIAANLEIEYTHFQFRVAIALALASEWEALGCKSPVGGELPVSPTLVAKQPSQRRQRFSTVLDFGDRFLDSQKHLAFFEKLPNREDSSSRNRQQLCRYCKSRRTTWWCKKCMAPLCQGSCLVNFHTQG